jgi:hypothetical protein
MEGFDVSRARWTIGGCVALFTVPFFIAGVNVLRAGIQAMHRHEGGAPFLLTFGVAFTAFSLGFVGMIWWVLRQGQAVARRMEVHTMQPWLWREDWVARRAGESTPQMAVALWIFAAMWNAITIPMALAVWRQFPQNRFVAVAFLFAALGLVLLGGALVSTLRRRKFGRSFCTFDRLPIEPGQSFSGTIEHRGTQVPEDGYLLVLSCVNRVVTRDGRSTSTSTETLWQTEQRLSGALAAPSPAGMRLPFTFEIPPDAPSSDMSNLEDAVLWQLEVTAELPGIDYKATFELPVFATAYTFAAHFAVRRDEAEKRELSPDAHATITALPSGGFELRVGPHRNASAFTVFILFAAIWFGAIALIWRFGAPLFIAGLFALVGVVILCIAIDFFAGKSIVSVDRNGVRTTHSVFGIRKTKEVRADDIASIAAKVGGHVGSHPYFDVEARLKDQSSRTLARYFVSRNDADAVAAKLWAALVR